MWGDEEQLLLGYEEGMYSVQVLSGMNRCWFRPMAAVHVTNEQQLEGRGFYLEKAEHYGREMLAGGYERKTLQKKKKFCSWFIFLLWAYPVSLFLEKSCSLRYHLSILETLLPREVCNSGKNKSWGCLKKKSGKSNRMAGSKGEWKGWLFWGATT